MRPTRIISGGQTGADLGALRAGKALGYVPGETLGGWMPRGFKNELGERPWMHEQFGMQEHASPQYQPRTSANIQEADVTLIFGERHSPGSKLAIAYVAGFKKPWYLNPPPFDDPRWIIACDGKVVNVAGNRESGNRGIEAYVYRVLIEAWGTPEQKDRLVKCAPWPDPLPTLSPRRP